MQAERFVNATSLRWGTMLGAVEKLEKVKYNWSVESMGEGMTPSRKMIRGWVTQPSGPW